MKSSKKSARPSQKEADVDVDEFARQFFGTDEDYNHKMPPKSLPIQQEKSRDPHKDDTNYKKVTIPGSQKDEKLNNYTSRGSNANLNHGASERSPKINGLNSKGKRGAESGQAVPKDFKQITLTRFLELRDEFYTLSKRLEAVNMPKISKRLTQMLAERQRLMVILLKLGEPSNDVPSYSNDEKLYERQNQSGESKHGDFGMLKKSKSVHWSDEHLGGSIIHDPTLTARQLEKPATLQEHMNNKIRNPPDFMYREGSEILFQTPSSPRQQPRHELHMEKLPPAYKMVDNFTQTRRRRQGLSQCDKKGSLCSFGIGHAIECIEEIVNEAAALRHEACCMLWRAHLLEQLCEADHGIVNHVYHESSDIPALPRYPHSHRHYR